jgi:hypothetical protein
MYKIALKEIRRKFKTYRLVYGRETAFPSPNE